jgi:hypothetical protein
MRRGLVLGLLVLGCRPGGPRATEAGSPAGILEIAWRDSTRAVRLAFPARARWCAADSLLEIVGTRQDSAVGLVLLGGDSALAGLGEGVYSVMPGKFFLPWRPRALAALRLAGSDAVTQYESSHGQVTVTRAGPDGLAGRMDLVLLASVGTDSLHLTGSFSGIRGQPAAGPCGRLDKPPPG